jgi:osmotically-inducible protein OsmY
LHVQGLNDTDRTLAQRVLEGLQTDTTLANVMPSVNINIINGRVVLQGTVQNERQRRAIVEAVQRAAGVQNVEDQLTVSR